MRAYLDNEVQHMAEAAHARLHPTYLGHENVEFLHHNIIAVGIITGNAEDLSLSERVIPRMRVPCTYLLFDAIFLEGGHKLCCEVFTCVRALQSAREQNISPGDHDWTRE